MIWNIATPLGTDTFIAGKPIIFVSHRVEQIFAKAHNTTTMVRLWTSASGAGIWRNNHKATVFRPSFADSRYHVEITQVKFAVYSTKIITGTHETLAKKVISLITCTYSHQMKRGSSIYIPCTHIQTGLEFLSVPSVTDLNSVVWYVTTLFKNVLPCCFNFATFV